MSERITGTALAEMLARNSGMPTSDAYNLDVQALVAEVLRLHALILGEYDAWNDEDGKPEEWLTEGLTAEAHAIREEHER
jgi:hypothetical protein